MRDCGVGKCGVTASEYRVFFWGDKNVLKLDYGDYCTSVNILEINKLDTFNR